MTIDEIFLSEKKLKFFVSGQFGPKLDTFGPKLFKPRLTRLVLRWEFILFEHYSFSGVNSNQNMCWYFSRLFDVLRKKLHLHFF